MSWRWLVHFEESDDQSYEKSCHTPRIIPGTFFRGVPAQRHPSNPGHLNLILLGSSLGRSPSLARQLLDHVLHSVGPQMIPALIWVQVAGHEVLREASPVVEEVPAEVQEKDLLIVGVARTRSLMAKFNRRSGSS